VSNLVEIDLGVDGINYIEECLRQGTGLSCKTLKLSLNSGRACAAVPAGTSTHRAKSFKTGGLLAWRDSIDWLSVHTARLWRENPAGTLIFEDTWGERPGDPFAQSDLVNKFFDTTNVYYFVQSPEENTAVIERRISSFLLVAFFVGFSLRETLLPQDHIVGKVLMNKIARSTKEIFVTAYDREGLVIWRR
jgi:hypothetical protein